MRSVVKVIRKPCRTGLSPPVPSALYRAHRSGSPSRAHSTPIPLCAPLCSSSIGKGPPGVASAYSGEGASAQRTYRKKVKDLCSGGEIEDLYVCLRVGGSPPDETHDARNPTRCTRQQPILDRSPSANPERISNGRDHARRPRPQACAADQASAGRGRSALSAGPV